MLKKKKKKKKSLKKNFLYFRKWNFQAPNLKTLIFQEGICKA